MGSTNELLKKGLVSFDDLYTSALYGHLDDRLEKHILQNGLTTEQYETVVSDLKEGLQWEKRDYSFDSRPSTEESQRLIKLRLVLLLFDYFQDSDKLQLLVLVSQYLNPWVPWSNGSLASEASKLLPKFADFPLQFLEAIKPSLLAIPNLKVTPGGYKRTGLGSGLRPALGFSGVGSGIYEDDKRKEWKSLQNVSALSTIYGFLAIPNDNTEFQNHWPLIITFILNVLDDSEPLFRIQGCHLVEHVLKTGHLEVLLKSGHVDLFLESTETCLNYLPSLTPANVSLRLLGIAYPLLYQLMALRDKPVSSYTAVLEKNILSSVAHVQGRSSDSGANKVLAFLLQQAESIIRDHIGGAVLGGFLRLNYTLCQLLTSPYLVDADGGAEVVDLALRVQNAAVEAFLSIKDNQGRELFVSHKYDLLGAWIVLLRRVEKFKVGTKITRELIFKNFHGLWSLAGSQIKEDYEAALEQSPGTLPSWSEVVQQEGGIL